MTTYTVVVTTRAANEIERAAGWWRDNRPGASGLFVEELATALAQLGQVPLTGRPFTSEHVPDVRAWLMPKTRYHLYYTVEEKRRTVQVRALWHAVRGRGPRLR